MNPSSTPELFSNVAANSVPLVRNEFLRRNLVAGVVSELSDQFSQKEHTSHPVTDPTLVAKMFALSHVQRTNMGIVGFHPLNAVDGRPSSHEVSAKAAPFHDEFTDHDGSTFRTRVVALTMPDEEYDDTIEVFGLNFYYPDPNTEDIEPAMHTSGLLLIGSKGAVSRKLAPITGETSVFAVRHKKTNDTKIYKVTLDMGATLGNTVQGMVYESDTRAAMKMPDGVVIKIEQLEGRIEKEVVSEFQASIDKLKTAIDPTAQLGSEEQLAVRSLTFDNPSRPTN